MPKKWQTFFGTAPTKICSAIIRSVSIFCVKCKTIGRRAARRLIVLHPKHTIDIEHEMQTCYRRRTYSSVKGFTDLSLIAFDFKFEYMALFEYKQLW